MKKVNAMMSTSVGFAVRNIYAAEMVERHAAEEERHATELGMRAAKEEPGFRELGGKLLMFGAHHFNRDRCANLDVQSLLERNDWKVVVIHEPDLFMMWADEFPDEPAKFFGVGKEEDLAERALWFIGNKTLMVYGKKNGWEVNFDNTKGRCVVKLQPKKSEPRPTTLLDAADLSRTPSRL
jgi:hypothetical protein